MSQRDRRKTCVTLKGLTYNRPALDYVNNNYSNYPKLRYYEKSRPKSPSSQLYMPYKMFVLAHQECPFGYLIAIPKAVYMLLNHKIRDPRVQFFLVQWVGALLVMLGVEMCGFSIMPTLIAAGVFAPALCFFAFLVWLAAGDIFLNFALEDEVFYYLATKSHVLSVFADADQLPSPQGPEEPVEFVISH